jgi:hypothetical protein
VTGTPAHKTSESLQGTVFSNTIDYQFQTTAGAADTEPGAAEHGRATNDYEFDIKAINCNLFIKNGCHLQHQGGYNFPFRY